MARLSTLRDVALSPALYAHCVPRGVLYDVGLALWEMPESVTGGGHMHGLRVLDFAAYHHFLQPPLRHDPSVATRGQLKRLASDLFHSEAAVLRLQDLETVYRRGSSIALQNLVFAPHEDSASEQLLPYRYDAEVNDILARWGDRPVYANVGMASHADFFTGAMRFNTAFAVECRAADNRFRGAVDAAGFGIGPTQYVHATSLLCSDLASRLWLHTVFDATHPDVVDVCLRSVGDLVTAFGTRLKYLLQGESYAYLYLTDPLVDRSQCGQVPLAVNCAACEPTTSYAERTVAGFRRYLQNVLRLTLPQLGARWNTTLASFAAVDPRTVHRCPAFPAAVRDYQEYLTYLLFEIGLLHYRHAKALDPRVECSTFRFHLAGMEESWLASDFGSVGNWHGESDLEYLDRAEHDLATIAAAGRLAGVPVSFPITAPVFRPVADPPGQDHVPPMFRSYRTYDRDMVRWLFRDVMTAGAVHIGHLKGPTTSFGADPVSVDAVLGGLQEIVDQHGDSLALCGPYQRVALHVEDLTAFYKPRLGVASARAAYHLVRRLRAQHVPCAIFSSDRVRARTLARWWLERSLILVPYHGRLQALRADYVRWFPAGAPGAALFVAERVGALPPWVDPQPVDTSALGTLHRVRDDGGQLVNCFYFAAQPPPPGADLDAHLAQVCDLVDAAARPFVERQIAPIGSLPFVPAPIAIAAPATANLVSNFVTDGVNFTVAVSNHGSTPAAVTVAVDPRVAAALALGHAPASFTLLPRQTRQVLLEASVGGEDLAAALAVAEQRLAVLAGDGFAVTDGRAVLDRAQQFLADARFGRALAALVAAFRMPFLRARHDAARFGVAVAARRLGLPAEPPLLPLTGARVQLLFPLNGREEQAVEATIDAAGNALIPVLSPLQPRWSPALDDVEPPPDSARWLVEVHVTDPLTGSSAAAMVRTLPPPIP